MKIGDLQNVKVLNQPSPISQGVNKQSPLGGFSAGIAKGGLSTLKGLGQIGESLLGQTAGRVANLASGKGFTPTTKGESVYNPQSSLGQRATQFLTPKTGAETLGFNLEQIGEYFIPAAKAAKAEQAINLLTKGISSSLLGASTRVLGKGLVQGLSAGTVKLAQTGGDVKESVKVAGLAGAVRGGMAVIGEGARALRIPERMYSMIFKNSTKDMVSEMKASGLSKLQRSNPEKFADFVQKGIIKVDQNGQAIINDTLAEQALDRGLRGSIRGMANTVVEKTLEAEDEVRSIVKTYQGTVNLKEKQFENVLRGIAQEYEDVGFGEISSQAKSLATRLSSSKGLVSAEDALEIRRLLDKARIASSFERPASRLSLTQANLKTLADAVRSRLNSIPGVGNTMKSYSFYIDALESLAREGARRGNNQVLSLIDSLFLSGAFAADNQIPAVTAGLLRRIFLSGPGISAFSALRNSNLSPLGSGAVSAGSSYLQSKLEGRQ